jgi:hypothetical protein
MKKQLISFCCLLAATLTLKAQNAGYATHVPKDASSIIRVNVPLVFSKVNISTLLEEMVQGSGKSNQTADDKYMLEVVKDPAKTGINLQQELWIMSNKLYAYDSTGYSYVMGSIKDTALFRKFLKAANGKKKQQLVKYSAGHYLLLSINDDAAFAWNSQFFISVKAKEATRLQTERYNNYDENGNEKPRVEKKINYAQLAANRAKAVLAGYTSTPFITDVQFTGSLATTADVVIWSKEKDNLGVLKNISKFGLKAPGADILGALKKPTDKAKTSVTAVRFENGKVAVTSTTQMDDELAGVMNNMMAGPISNNLTSRILPGNVLGWMSMNMNIKGIKDLMPADMGAEINKELAAYNLSADELMNAFQGEAMLVLMAPKNTLPGEKPKPQAYFAATVKNKPTVEKLFAMMEDIKAKKAKEKEAMVDVTIDSTATAVDSTAETIKEFNPPPPSKKGPLGEMKMIKLITDDVLVVAGSDEMTQLIANNKTGADVSFMNADIKQSPFTFYIDVQAIYKMMIASDAPETSKEKDMAQMFAMFDKLLIYSTAPAKNSIDTKVDLLLTDANTNSLQQLMEIFKAFGMKGLK